MTNIMIIIPEVTAKTKANYEDVSDILNTWPITKDWERVIDDKGPIVIKNRKRYHCYTLPAERIDREDVKSWLYRQDLDLEEKDLCIHTGYTKDVDQWLKENKYAKLLTEEKGE